MNREVGSTGAKGPSIEWVEWFETGRDGISVEHWSVWGFADKEGVRCGLGLVVLDVGEARMELLLLVLDLVGTFVFALSGGVAAARRRLDVFGVQVVAFAAAVSGGIARDLLIGAVPPAALSNLSYLMVSLLAEMLAFYFHERIERFRNPVLVFDGLGLAVFAVAGSQKALMYGLDPVMAALLGMLTGIGGGIARDILLADIPAVLRSEVYAVAALAGAAAVVMGDQLGLPSVGATIAGALLCFGLRLMAIRKRWALPVAVGLREVKDDDGDDGDNGKKAA